MNKTIHIREAVTPEEVERFWQELHAYHARDIFPDPAEEDRAYFLDDSQYRAAVQRIHDRDGDRCYYLLFRREGRDIGFALTALYPSEDGKCFVMEDIVLRESVGTCIRCGDPLFPSDISGYAYQCFKCDEDFYAFEQGRNS